jgi:hypothetical protein
VRVVREGVNIDCGRKHLNGAPANLNPTEPANANTNGTGSGTGHAQPWGAGIVNPSDINNPEARRWSGSSNDGDHFVSSHVPHPICKLYTMPPRRKQLTK